MQYREANKFDIPGMAKIRAGEWGTEAYWISRVSGYLDLVLHPQKALIPRITYVASETDINTVAGFIAGHLTHRYECDGELQWINVIPRYQRSGIASELLKLLTIWFIEQKAFRICVGVDPSNIAAQHFYKKHGAEKLNDHWLIWNDINIVLKK